MNKFDKRILHSLFTLILGLICSQPLPAQNSPSSKTASEPKNFAEVVQEYFGQWDSNGDGVLSKEEIESAATNPKVRGDAAAAVATLVHFVRNKDFTLPPITKDYLTATTALDSKSADEQSDQDEDANSDIAKRPSYQRTFHKYLLKVNQTSRQLFPQNIPSFEAVHQGSLGDCPFVSTVGALVYRNPAVFKAMFVEKDNGSTSVTFGNGQSLNIHNLTDVDIAIWSSAGTNGLWLTILEKAYRRILVATEHPDPKDRPSIYDKFGPSARTIEILDGHQTRKVEMRSVRAGKIELDALRRDLIVASSEKLLVKAETPAGKKTPGISPDHAYAVLGYDKGTDLVHVWNPHGNNFTPKGTDGLQNGYITKRGEFDVPLRDLDQIFSDLNFETKALAKQ